MNETMTPGEAARVLVDAAGFEASLQQRTEGLTLMLWGIVSSAIFTTYGFLALLGAHWIAFATVWFPWVLAGVAFTFAMWRSASLTLAPAQREGTRAYWLRTLALTALVTVIFSIFRPDGPAMPLAVLGAIYAAAFGVDLWKASPTGRRLGFAAGSLLAILGAGLALSGAPIELAGGVAMIAPGAVLGAFGLWQTLTS